MGKTLGQVAFEAAKEAGPVSFIGWDEQSCAYRAGWQAAAEAVVKEWMSDVGYWLDFWPQHKKVIEAAKAAPYEIKSILESIAFAPPENMHLHHVRLAELGNHLHEVVEALLAAEGEH
jgi:hypothetical protein